MKILFILGTTAILTFTVQAQVSKLDPSTFTIEKSLAATPVKNQAMTGTCWCFSATSLVESNCMKATSTELDLSEMFTVRNIYIEKARNYLLRQGHAQFSEGGLGHDMIRGISIYGAIPENVYTGMKAGQKEHDHQKMVASLKTYLDSLVKLKTIPADWQAGYENILNNTMGLPPTSFDYNGKRYNPKEFADNVVKFNPDDYVYITSFTHHPYYQPFIIEVPDNFSNGAYYNLPLNEMISLAKESINKGYSLMWDADVSNAGFQAKRGIALNINDKKAETENSYDATTRQQLFETLNTQDDHLMHITGLSKSPDGKWYFVVKNSWGSNSPTKGFIHVSEAYFAINTISLVLPKEALGSDLLKKLNIR